MKIRKIALFAGLALFTQIASANITLMSLSAQNICASLTGTWTGTGVLVSSLANCQYKGTITVVPGNVPGSYLAEALLTSAGGSSLCPPEVPLKMSGTCENNKVTLQTDDDSSYNTNLNGTVNAAGTSADLSGSVIVTVFFQQIHALLQSVHIEKSEA